MKITTLVPLFVVSFVYGESQLKKPSGDVFVQKVFGDDNPFNGVISLGTPAQEITVIFDSGSFDPNVLAPNATTCGDDSCIYGTYLSSNSSTSNLTSEKYYAGYGSATFYTYSGGVFDSDALSISDKSISNFKFAVIDHSDDIVNIFGIGYGLNTYPGLHSIDQFIANGLMSKKIYTVYYSNTTQTGGLVFGGIDNSKYYGTLETVDMAKNDLDVEVSAIGTDCGVIISNPGVFTVDTGTTYTYLTTDNYILLHLAIGASKVSNYTFDTFTQDDGSDSYVLKCSSAPELKFWFAGKEVTFYPNSYALPLIDPDGNVYRDADGDEICGTSFFSGTDENILGAYQLKDIFTVIDIDSRQFSFAQGFDTESEDVVAITGDVPGAVAASTYPGNSKTIIAPSYTPTIELSIQGLDNVGQRYTGPFSSPSCSSVKENSTLHSTRTETIQVAVCLTCSASLTSSGQTPITSSLVTIADVNINSTVTETITSCSASECKISSLTSTTTPAPPMSPLFSLLPSSSLSSPATNISPKTSLLSSSFTPLASIIHRSLSDQGQLSSFDTELSSTSSVTFTGNSSSLVENRTSFSVLTTKVTTPTTKSQSSVEITETVSETVPESEPVPLITTGSGPVVQTFNQYTIISTASASSSTFPSEITGIISNLATLESIVTADSTRIETIGLSDSYVTNEASETSASGATVSESLIEGQISGAPYTEISEESYITQSIVRSTDTDLAVDTSITNTASTSAVVSAFEGMGSKPMGSIGFLILLLSLLI